MYKFIIKRGYGWDILRVLVGVIFIAASIYKIAWPGTFAHQIYNYKILPVWLINPVAIVLPWIQLLCGAALLTRRFTKGASLLLLLMMIVFQVALAAALLRGLNISCGCFKAGGAKATWATFLRDFSILILTGLQFWKELRKESEIGLWMSRDH